MKASTLRYFLYPSSRKTQQTKTCLVLKCLSKIPATNFPLLSKCLQSSPTSNYLTKRARWPLRVCRLLPNNFNLSSVASTSLCPRLIMVLKHVGGSSNIIPFFKHRRCSSSHNSLRGIHSTPLTHHPVPHFAPNSVNSYSAVLPPSPMVFF